MSWINKAMITEEDRAYTASIINAYKILVIVHEGRPDVDEMMYQDRS
jgi:hypothetical protein